MTTESAKYLTELHQLLNQHFNLAEIRTLCLELNVDYESLAGEEKPSRIRELLLGLARNGRIRPTIFLPIHTSQCPQHNRPALPWREVRQIILNQGLRPLQPISVLTFFADT